MKFSEKLIKLRKEKLLSQEELGEKLNVTRQTVSKWELGQTTPDMEKLVEMSKLFGVSLDELTSESELNTDEPIKEKNHTKRNVVIIILLIAILLGCIVMVTGKIIGNKIGTFTGVFSKVTETLGNAKWETKYFNQNFDFYNGTASGSRVQSLIDKIVTNNKTSDRKVTVNYNDTKTSDPNELIEIKRNFDNAFDKFEISFEYGEDGYIYQATISYIEENSVVDEVENKLSDWDIEYNKHSFNSTLEMYNGTKSGHQVRYLIDKIVTNNQTNDRLVTVKYNGTETTDPAELRTLKRNFDDTWAEFEVYFEYGEDGYIYEAIIEKL